MIEHEYVFRVMYPDTDQMRAVHHSNYARYYETARWELLRMAGISYLAVEEAGFMLPVIQMHFRFLKPVHYDDLLTAKTTLKHAKGARIWFTYRLFNAQGELVNEAETELACVHKENWRPCMLPDFLVKAIFEHANHEHFHA